MTENQTDKTPAPAPAAAPAAQTGIPRWLIYGFAAKIALAVGIVLLVLWLSRG